MANTEQWVSARCVSAGQTTTHPDCCCSSNHTSPETVITALQPCSSNLTTLRACTVTLSDRMNQSFMGLSFAPAGAVYPNNIFDAGCYCIRRGWGWSVVAGICVAHLRPLINSSTCCDTPVITTRISPIKIQFNITDCPLGNTLNLLRSMLHRPWNSKRKRQKYNVEAMRVTLSLLAPYVKPLSPSANLFLIVH